MSKLSKKWSHLVLIIIREKLIINKLKSFFENPKHKFLKNLLFKIHPNYLTLSRSTIFPAIVIYFLVTGQPQTALIFWLIGWLTDFLDGPWSVITNKTSELGKRIDPICDKIFFISVLLVALFTIEMSDSLRLVLYSIIGLDFIMPFLYILAVKSLKIKPKIDNNAFGKTKMFLLFLLVPLLLLSKLTPVWQNILIVLAALVLFFSAITIFQEMKKFLFK